MKTVFTIGLVQMGASGNKQEDLAQASTQVAALAGQGADLVLLPEMFCCPYKTTNFPLYAEEQGGESFQTLAGMAQSNGVYLVGGSVPERAGEKIYNTSYAFGRDGRLLGRHRKMHLFDVNFENGQKFQESATLTAGDEVTVFDTEFCKMGLCICYDIRFPELARLMVDEGAQMILVPAAFNMTTGPLHWELLFRGRAADNQVFMAGCAPSRDVNGVYVSYANSIVTSPFGEVLLRMDEKDGTALCQIDLNRVQEARKALPLLKHRRKDLYTLKKNK